MLLKRRSSVNLSERLFAAYYPFVAARSERAGQGATRDELLAGTRGRVLEVGAGHGLNLAHYPDGLDELVLTDPSPWMLQRAPAGTEILQAGLPSLPFADGRFDTVVCTYVLCSVPEPAAALAEIARVLAPGGRLLFLEHVRAGEESWLGRLQDLIERPHRIAAAGCRPNRRTEDLLAASPLHVDWLVHGAQPSTLPTVRPTIMGAARRR
jgi:ubiquinone/menaquinone biosynthesis C-methylase UbiE